MFCRWCKRFCHLRHYGLAVRALHREGQAGTVIVIAQMIYNWFALQDYSLFAAGKAIFQHLFQRLCCFLVLGRDCI